MANKKLLPKGTKPVKAKKKTVKKTVAKKGPPLPKIKKAIKAKKTLEVVPAPEKKEKILPKVTKRVPSRRKKVEEIVMPPVQTAVVAPPPAPPAIPAKPVEVPPSPVAPPKPFVTIPPAPVVTVEKPVEKPKEVKPKIRINETTTVAALAEKIGVKPAELIKKLLSLGSPLTINQRIDLDTATLTAAEYNFDVEFVPLYGEDVLLKEEKVDLTKVVPRAPVVTIMGHVDHGKTSLLDAIRQTKLAEKEFGGITQHIGAYRVKSKDGEIIFLDTPGHEAFTAMRARGAQVTDIVVLVVAADDGVMPQTVESIDHARAANVLIIVAVNKIDLPTANVQKVKQELAQLGLIPEEWGGKTIFVEVSAKKQVNLDKLLEMILLQADMLELKTNLGSPAQGIVIEARLDSRKGPLATVLVQKGVLHIGDSFLAGFTWGKVKALINDRGQRLPETRAVAPAEVMGFSGTPQVGDRFVVVSEAGEAKRIAERRQQIRSQESVSRRRHISLSDLYQRVKEGQLKELRLILKADVQGSLEAIKDALSKFVHPEITLSIIHSGTGGISESDCLLAAASDAIIIGFNVRPEPSTEKLAKEEGVDIRTYRIIYELTDEIKKAMEGLLEPGVREKTIGRVLVRQLFRIPKVGTIAGCYVEEGKVVRGQEVRLLRDNAIVYSGAIASLRRFKDDVKEVEKGYECGISLENFQDLKVGDILEVYEKVEVARKLTV